MRAAVALALDVVLLGLFAALGRRTHDGGAALAGIARVAAPFVLGWLAGGAVARLRRDPLDLRRAAAAWAVALPLGLALRWLAFGGGLAPAFVAVAAVTTAVLLLGWRAVARAVAPRRRSRSPA